MKERPVRILLAASMSLLGAACVSTSAREAAMDRRYELGRLREEAIGSTTRMMGELDGIHGGCRPSYSEDPDAYPLPIIPELRSMGLTESEVRAAAMNYRIHCRNAQFIYHRGFWEDIDPPIAIPSEN